MCALQKLNAPIHQRMCVHNNQRFYELVNKAHIYKKYAICTVYIDINMPALLFQTPRFYISRVRHIKFSYLYIR